MLKSTIQEPKMWHITKFKLTEGEAYFCFVTVKIIFSDWLNELLPENIEGRSYPCCNGLARYEGKAKWPKTRTEPFWRDFDHQIKPKLTFVFKNSVKLARKIITQLWIYKKNFFFRGSLIENVDLFSQLPNESNLQKSTLLIKISSKWSEKKIFLYKP